MGQGALDEVVRRLEANLKAERCVKTPFGTVRLGEHVYIRRAAGEVALATSLEASRGWLFKSATEIRLELVDVGSAGGGPAAGLEKLKAAIAAEEARLRNRLDLEALVAVYSASGWDEEALGYVRNDPPGSGYAHRTVHLVLVGPAPSDLKQCAHDELAGSMRIVLRGRTDDEEEALARDRIDRALTVDSYAVLGKIARASHLDAEAVERAARTMASRDGDLVMSKVRGAGLVLRKKG